MAAVVTLGAALVRSQDTAAPAGPTLASIRARGELACGVNQDLYGFGYLDPNTGEISGFDVDFCRALAVATLGDIEGATLNLHTVESGEAALISGDIDILLHNVSDTLSQDVSGQLDFGPPNFYSGQTIMVAGDSGLDTWDALAGKIVCTTIANAATLASAMAQRGIEYEALPLETVDAAQEAFVAGRCDANVADWVTLSAQRYESDTPFAYIIWEDPFTIEPLAPVYRYGDEQWADIVEWTFYGLVRAEELGVTSENIDELDQSSDNPEIVVLLNSGEPLGLAEDYLVEVIRQVGNYGEIFERHLGDNTPLRLPRGLNALWRDGGMMYAPRWG